MFEDGVSASQSEVEKEYEFVLCGWMKEIYEYRLHSYFEKKTSIY